MSKTQKKIRWKFLRWRYDIFYVGDTIFYLEIRYFTWRYDILPGDTIFQKYRMSKFWCNHPKISAPIDSTQNFSKKNGDTIFWTYDSSILSRRIFKLRNCLPEQSLVSYIKKLSLKVSYKFLKYDVMTSWRHDVMTSSWRYDVTLTLWRHHDVMTSLWRYDIIMTSWRQCDVIMTSLWRHHDVMTSSCYDVIGLSILIFWTLTSTSPSSSSCSCSSSLLDYRGPQRS